MDAAELYAVDAACPLLGLAADPQTHYTYPHPGHRCGATAAPIMIEPWKQAAHCLSLSFKTCNRYVAWQAEKALAAQPGPAPEPAETPAATTEPAPKRPPRQRPSTTSSKGTGGASQPAKPPRAAPRRRTDLG